MKKNRIALIVLSISLIILILITKSVFVNDVLKIDDFFHSLIVENLRNDSLTNIFKIITHFGDSLILISTCIFLILFLKNKRYGIYATLNLGFIALVNVIIKNIIRRPRPIGFNIIEETGFSYPSGHSMASTAFYGLLIYFIFKSNIDKTKKILYSSLLSLLVLLIMLSRVYLGIHYASDVIAGCLISICYLIIFISIFSKKGDIIKKNTKMLGNSFIYALKGIKTAFKSEQNLKIHFTIMILVIILGISLNISLIEWIICIIQFILVISAEMINTAVENTVDLVTDKYHKKAKMAKDISAGAVLICATGAAIIGGIIFIPKILEFILI